MTLVIVQVQLDSTVGPEVMACGMGSDPDSGLYSIYIEEGDSKKR